MLIITLRTDKPEAELGIYENQKKLTSLLWPAHRELAETIHQKLREILTAVGKDWSDIEGLVVYRGPGSFTGLRIGLSVANAIADGQQAAIVGTTGDNWQTDGIKKLLDGQNERQVLPEYGASAHITKQRK